MGLLWIAERILVDVFELEVVYFLVEGGLLAGLFGGDGVEGLGFGGEAGGGVFGVGFELGEGDLCLALGYHLFYYQFY